MRSPNFRTAIALLLFFCSLAQGVTVTWEERNGKVKLPRKGGGTEEVDVYAYISISQEYGTGTVIDRTFLINQAKQAMADLKTRLLNEGWGEELWPGAVTALKVPGAKKIYFASSIKGGGGVPGKAAKELEIDRRVIQALQDCRAESGDAPHNNSGKCGEIMVTNLWFQGNTSHSGSQLPRGGKLIVTVNKERKVIKPCQNSHGRCGDKSSGKSWGCKEFLEKIGFNLAQEVINSDPTIRRRSGTVSKKLGSKSGAACPLTPTQKQPVKKPKVKEQKPKVKGPVKKPVRKPVKNPTLPRRGASVR